MSDYVIIQCQKHNVSVREGILLVLKDKPDWQKGRLNLPGGKVEEGESPDYTAIRELKEETGYTPWVFPQPNPRRMGLLQDGDDRIFCYKVVVDGWNEPSPRDEETQQVLWMPWDQVKEDPRLIPNLRVIISLMVCEVDDWIIKDEYRSCDQSHHSIEVLVPTHVH